MHFPILLLVNGLYTKLEWASPPSAIFALFFALTAAIGAATLFYRWIESPEASRRITGALGWLVGKSLTLASRIPGLRRLAPSQRLSRSS